MISSSPTLLWRQLTLETRAHLAANFQCDRVLLDHYLSDPKNLPYRSLFREVMDGSPIGVPPPAHMIANIFHMKDAARGDHESSHYCALFLRPSRFKRIRLDPESFQPAMGEQSLQRVFIHKSSDLGWKILSKRVGLHSEMFWGPSSKRKCTA